MEATVVYRFHVALRDVSPKVWRRVELTAGSSLADLQRVIQISLRWSDEYLHRFCIRNHYLGASRPGGLLFFGDPETMTLSQFAFRLHERFTYEYNFFDAWLLDIRFEGEHALDPKRHYPRCVAGARRAPLEDGGGAEIFMDRQITETPAARKRRHAERKLRDIAKLLEDPALDDVAFRARSRVSLGRRL
jgi:Plasmid pRiA4b ORF-3-like protein